MVNGNFRSGFCGRIVMRNQRSQEDSRRTPASTLDGERPDSRCMGPVRYDEGEMMWTGCWQCHPRTKGNKKDWGMRGSPTAQLGRWAWMSV